MGISKLDTVKDKDGKRFRVTDVRSVDGQIIAVLKGIHPDGSPRRGGARNVRVDVLERDYTRVDLPPVTIRKIDDLSEEEKPVVKEPTPSEKAAQIEKEAVRELSRKDIEKAVDASTFGGPKKPDETNDAYKHRMNREITEAVLEAKRREAENSGQDIEILRAEILDMKKTISKMRQSHAAEVEDLKDQLMEAQAEANALKRYRGEVLQDRARYSAELDDNGVAFGEILHLAEVVQLMSTGAAKIAKEIIEKTEVRS